MAITSSRGSKPLVMDHPDSDNVAKQVYSPAANRRGVISKIIVTNVSGTTITNWTVYIDDDGSTYDDDSSFLVGTAITEFKEINFDDGFEIDENANVAIRSAQ